MYTQIEKTKTNKTQLGLNSNHQKSNVNEPTQQIVDKRPETVSQRIVRRSDGSQIGAFHDSMMNAFNNNGLSAAELLLARGALTTALARPIAQYDRTFQQTVRTIVRHLSVPKNVRVDNLFDQDAGTYNYVNPEAINSVNPFLFTEYYGDRVTTLLQANWDANSNNYTEIAWADHGDRTEQEWRDENWRRHSIREGAEEKLADIYYKNELVNVDGLVGIARRRFQDSINQVGARTEMDVIIRAAIDVNMQELYNQDFGQAPDYFLPPRDVIDAFKVTYLNNIPGFHNDYDALRAIQDGTALCQGGEIDGSRLRDVAAEFDGREVHFHFPDVTAAYGGEGISAVLLAPNRVHIYDYASARDHNDYGWRRRRAELNSINGFYPGESAAPANANAGVVVRANDEDQIT
jgi:hypothetical protein